MFITPCFLNIFLTKDHVDSIFCVCAPLTGSTKLIQGGYFHLKVGGAKSSGNAGDPMLGFAVSGE